MAGFRILQRTDESYAKGRKLRHLTGIVLRNLTTQKVPSRPRGKSADDDYLAAAWETPSKDISAHPGIQGEGRGRVEGESSVGETMGPVHSKSSNDLPAGEFERFSRPRRRSARGNPVGTENPILRQKRLECVAAERMADVFFTLHIPEFGGERCPTCFCSFEVVFVEEEALS